MTGNNLNSIFVFFYSSTLNQKSPTPSPNPSPKPSRKHTSSLVQQSELMVESPNPTLIIQILEKAMNLADSENLIGESTDDLK